MTNSNPTTMKISYSGMTKTEERDALKIILGEAFDGETQKITEKDEGESKYLKWRKTLNAEDHASYRRLLD